MIAGAFRIMTKARLLVAILSLLLLSTALIPSGCAARRAANEKRYPIKGKVIAVEKTDRTVTIEHEDIAGYMQGGGYGHRELVLRVNGIDTPWAAGDLAAASDLAIDAVLLPKVESLELGDITPRAKVLRVETSESKELDVSEADIIVSGGRGIKGPENWPVVRDLSILVLLPVRFSSG
jgi:electron transfer flavoprotein alpha subunit